MLFSVFCVYEIDFDGGDVRARVPVGATASGGGRIISWIFCFHCLFSTGKTIKGEK